jgi:predicted HTH domain antitoxin
MTLVIPDEIIQAARMTEQEVVQTLAMALFQKEKLTLGQAARFAGVSQIEFQRLLASQGISVHYDVADFEEDLATLRAMGGCDCC